MLTGLGRRLVDACVNCSDFGIESIENGRMTVKCDKGKISSCVQQFTSTDRPYGYI
jgi:hypothetical protein